jgi:hypothetical protein
MNQRTKEKIAKQKEAAMRKLGITPTKNKRRSKEAHGQ